MSVDTHWQPDFLSEAIGGDRRYHYVPFFELSMSDQAQARRSYPYKRNVGAKYDFVDEHYLYPVRKNGRLARGRRYLAIPYNLISDPRYMEELGYEVNAGWRGR